MSRRRDELRHDVLGVATRAHAQRLEALQTVRVVNVQLFQGEARVLDEVGKERRILHWLHCLVSLRKVLDRNA